MRIQRTQMKPILTSSLALATFVGQVLTAATLPVDAKTHKLSATRQEPRIQLARLPFTKSKEEKEAQEEKEKSEKKKDEEKKAEKSNKSEKSEKKAEKSEKSEKKAEAKEEEKPVKKGFFGGKKEEKKTEKTETVEKKETEKVVEEKSAPKKSEREKQEAPKFVPDAALISILKDISKALPQAGETQGIANADEKTIVELAQQVLDKAISQENLPNDRILAKGTDGKSSMQTEAWASGEVRVSDKLSGSVACVWGKRIKGLFTITIAGESDKTVDNGSKVGEFIVVLQGKSPVQSGFDIQSQSEVSFWKGEVASIKVESACLPREESTETSDEKEAKEVESKGAEPVKKKPLAILDSVSTRRIKQFQVELAAFNKHEEELEALELARVEAEAKEAETKAAEEKEKIALAAKEKAEKKEAEEEKATREATETAKSDKAEKADEVKAKATETAENKEDRKTAETKKTAENPDQQQNNSGERISVASINLPPANSSRVWESPSINSEIRQPSLEANLVTPERAIAGKFITVSVVDKNNKPEPSFELSFNGSTITTDTQGQAMFMVPEDATPGRTLNISLSSRPELTPDVIDILQPLNWSDGQAPSIDRVSPLVSSSKQLIVNGHDFEGMSRQNHIMVDNQFEAQVLASSPVQLRIVVPGNLSAGPHTVTINNSGLRSNSSRFEYITAQVVSDERKGNLDKLTIKVQGTSNPVHIRVVNQSPDVIKLTKGNNLLVTTSGGIDNSYVMGAKRLKKGDYKIDTKIEL